MTLQTTERRRVDAASTKLGALIRTRYEIEMNAVAVRTAEGLRQSNEELALAKRQLIAANAELEAFSYSMSHDLRNPVRDIDGYAKILVEEYGQQLSQEARRYLDMVIKDAQQMGLLLDALLHLAKVSRRELSLQVTPLNSILRAAHEMVSRNSVGRNVQWRLDGLMATIPCDRDLMKLVFVNLLSNALKYTCECPHAVIEAGQLSVSDPQVFFVRDNGVGFDMKYAGNLFGIFQRLHSAHKFEGAGAGLATVERIVRKHGGHIWAEAEPDCGATFYFTLAASQMSLPE